MKHMFRNLAIAGALLATLAPNTLMAQDLPKKTLTMMVGFAAGGAADNAARRIAKKLSENIGQSVIVDNRAGAGGNIAHQLIANGESDGSLILLGSIGPLAIAPHLMKVGYDPQKDIEPIAMGMVFPNILVVHSSLNVKTLKDYVDLAKAKPGTLNFASTGSGSASHLAGELFNQMAGVDIVHIPYKGGAPAMMDLISGQVSSYFSTYSSAAPHIASGKLVPLASTGLSRPSYAQDLPTVAESGYPGFNAVNWYAFVGSAKMKPAMLDRWNQEIVKVLNAKDVSEDLVHNGLIPQPGSRAELKAYIDKESKLWGKLIAERKITAD